MYKDINQTFVSFQMALDSHYTHLNAWLSIWHRFLSDFLRLFYVFKKWRKEDCQEYSSYLEAEEKKIIWHYSSYEVWKKRTLGVRRRA